MQLLLSSNFCTALANFVQQVFTLHIFDICFIPNKRMSSCTIIKRWKLNSNSTEQNYGNNIFKRNIYYDIYIFIYIYLGRGKGPLSIQKWTIRHIKIKIISLNTYLYIRKICLSLVLLNCCCKFIFTS